MKAGADLTVTGSNDFSLATWVTQEDTSNENEFIPQLKDFKLKVLNHMVETGAANINTPIEECGRGKVEMAVECNTLYFSTSFERSILS